MPSAIPPVREHMVSIIRGAGVTLALLEPCSLYITDVLPEGHVDYWNRQNPDQQVRQGDSIVEVNGIRGGSHELIDACKVSSTLNMLIRSVRDEDQRQCSRKEPVQAIRSYVDAFKRTVTRQSSAPCREHLITITKADELGLGLTNEGHILAVTAVLPQGLVHGWNLANPSLQMHQGDRIVEVNGFHGDGSVMYEMMQRCAALHMIVRTTADLVRRHGEIEYSNMVPQDVEVLRLLDDALPPRTNVRRSFVAQLPKETALCAGVESCSICLNDFPADAKLTQLTCKHCFCTQCIETWLTQRRAECPLCKTPVQCPDSDSREGDACTQALLSDDSIEANLDMESCEGNNCSTILRAYVMTPKMLSGTAC